jgi:hypothetical protein
MTSRKKAQKTQNKFETEANVGCVSSERAPFALFCG